MAAQQNEVLIYPVGLLGDESPREAERARRAMDVLAQATGGQAYYPADVSEIDRVAQDLRSRDAQPVHCTYIPDNQEPGRVVTPKIRVLVDAPGVAHVRTRSGYYATPNRKGNTD